MKCETDLAASPCMVRLGGDVDMACVPALTQLEEQLSSRSAVIVDLAELRYADTNFLRFLIRLKRHENKSDTQAVRLVRVSRRLRRLLDITGLRPMFSYD